MSFNPVDSTDSGTVSPLGSSLGKSNTDNEMSQKRIFLPTPNYVDATQSTIQLSQNLDILPPVVAFPLPDISTPPPQVPFFRTPPPILQHTPITIPPPTMLHHTPITIPPPILPQRTSNPPLTAYHPLPYQVVPAPVTVAHIPFASSSVSNLGANTSMMQSTTTVMTALPPSAMYSSTNSTVSEASSNSPHVNGDHTLVQNIPTSAEQDTVKETSVNSTVAEKSETESTTEIKLPPDWRTAKDPEGNIYYYHAYTRQTQWDPPAWDDDQDESDVPSPPPDDTGSKPQRESETTAAPADTSNALEAEIAKKVKERFRLKVSNYVVHCLNPYRKLDCLHGRITTTKDFKHLARKLTHFIMAKEIKQCKNIIEDLEYNIDVKCKTKEFIKTYMSKYGAVYKKDKVSEE